jgi:hypothetical protein
VRQIAGVKVLQAPGNDSDLIAPYHTMNWTLDDAMRVRDKLGHWDRHHGLGEKVATLSYPCLQQPKDQQPA